MRAYDLRGVFGHELGLHDAYALGLSYASVARERGARRIAVGRDGRTSSPGLESALVAGLVAGGMDVLKTGLGPTPQLYFAVNACELDGGIMVTGSHNPADQNGFKIVLGSEPVYGDALRALVCTEGRNACGGSEREALIGDAYVSRLACLADRMRACKVVWDCGNGAVGAVIGALTERLPGTHVLMNAEIDGTFPAHHPDPSVAANLEPLRAAVLACEADVGIAFDGDGDRIGIVDHTGAIIWPDQLLLLLAEDVLRGMPGAPVVADVKSSNVLFDGIHRLGGRAVMAPSGYVLLRARMTREKSPLAGEMSGHIVVGDEWCRVDDALYVALRMLVALGRRGGCLADFRAALPAISSTDEIRIPCCEARKRTVVEEVAARLRGSDVHVDVTDGLRVTTDQGWWLLRASGTEPKLALRCEAADEEGLRQVCQELAGQLRLCGIEAPALLQY